MGTYPPGNYPFPKITLEDDVCFSKGRICDPSLEGGTYGMFPFFSKL